MKNIVRKLIFENIYEIGRNESWFHDMAKKGLHLKKIGAVFISFEKGEPIDTIYRIVLLNGASVNEKTEEFISKGWELAATRGDWYVFSSDDKNAAELYVDPIEQAIGFKEIDRKLKFGLCFVAIAVIFLIGMIASLYIFNDEPILAMVEGNLLQQILLIIVELYVLANQIKEYNSFNKIKKMLSEGQQIDHNKDYKKHRFSRRLAAGFFIGLAALSVIIPIADIKRQADYELPAEAINLAVVRLADIENDANLIREAGFTHRDIDWGNRISKDWSILAPVQYEVEESGIVPGVMWYDLSGEYSPGIQTRYYQLLFSNMAEGLLNDLKNRYIRYGDGEAIEQMSDKVDKLYTIEDGIKKQIFICKDNKVMQIVYYGNADIKNIIPLAIEKIIVE